jgi:competence protein ComEA
MEKIPINLVDVELLQTVPGIGEQLATRLVKERQAHGPFKSAEDLMRVTGIGISRSQQFQKVLRFD